MHTFFSQLLCDKKDGITFSCFGVWHLAILAGFVGIAVLLCCYLKNQGKGKKEKWIDFFIHLAFGLYIADFFLMPLAYGEIDIEKLPFHVCTAMCVMCFLSRHSRALGKYRLQFAALGFVSNLIYLIYPAGVMWHGVHPLSYRVLQTLCFHGVMAVYGVLVLRFDSEHFSWKKCYRDVAVIAAMTLWAMLGNGLYNSESRVYNWFFVTRDPFYMLDESIAPFVMPLLNIALFTAVEMLVYLAFAGNKKQIQGHGRHD